MLSLASITHHELERIHSNTNSPPIGSVKKVANVSSTPVVLLASYLKLLFRYLHSAVAGDRPD